MLFGIFKWPLVVSVFLIWCLIFCLTENFLIFWKKKKKLSQSLMPYPHANWPFCWKHVLGHRLFWLLKKWIKNEFFESWKLFIIESAPEIKKKKKTTVSLKSGRSIYLKKFGTACLLLPSRVLNTLCSHSMNMEIQLTGRKHRMSTLKAEHNEHFFCCE